MSIRLEGSFRRLILGDVRFSCFTGRLPELANGDEEFRDARLLVSNKAWLTA
jgi:hypothetical protein